jgi:hypothetical protein
MKRFIQIVTTAVIAVAPFATSDSALAAATCKVGFTGPDSNNLCVSEQTYKCEVTNDNKVTVKNENDQVAITGEASADSNTESGNVSTGSATNENGTTFNFTVENSGDAKVCTVVATVPATVTPPAAPVKPSGGRGSAAPAEVKETVVAPQQTTPAVLPNTSADSTMAIIPGSIGLLATGLLASRLGVIAYSRMKS